MAKAQGIIGNFKGKIGNTVGYQLTSSNNKQTQGIRIYQPNVKNPKTSAQAEQRAKLAPINATYRALKMIIDRGNEGLPYGNKSRLAWLKQAFKAEQMPWFEKGALVSSPVLAQLTKGSLPSIMEVADDDSYVNLPVNGLVNTDTTIGAVSTKILAAYPSLKDGDQLTFVETETLNGTIMAYVGSIVLDTTSTATLPTNFKADNGTLSYAAALRDSVAGCLIVSREGDNGEHLRSNATLARMAGFDETIYGSDAKTAAIESYMASGAANTDWAEESIQ